MSKDFQTFWQEVARADEARVKFIVLNMSGFFNRVCHSNPRITDVDQFMAIHNFHKLVLLNMEQQLGLDTEGQLLFRQMAVDTLRKGLEEQPAFPKDPQASTSWNEGKKLIDDLMEAMNEVGDLSDSEHEWMVRASRVLLDPAMFPAMLDLIALAYDSNLGHHYCGLGWNIDAGFLLLDFGYLEEDDDQSQD